MQRPEDLAAALSSSMPTPPLRQDAFELEEKALWSTIETPSHDLLLSYHMDLSHVDRVDPDLLRYLLPFSMGAWQESLSGSTDAMNCTAELCAALYRRPGLIEQVLGAAAQRSVEEFARASLSAFVSGRGSPDLPNLEWVPAWVGLSCGLPRLSETWWDTLRRSESPGMATAFLSYVSRIAYPPMHNPVFGTDYEGFEPWTRYEYISGGMHWQPAAIDALADRASPFRVREALDGIADRVDSANRELCELVADDFPNQIPVYRERLEEMLRNLAASDPPEYWTDMYAV
jgi:hypothetical protein